MISLLITTYVTSCSAWRKLNKLDIFGILFLLCFLFLLGFILSLLGFLLKPTCHYNNNKTTQKTITLTDKKNREERRSKKIRFYSKKDDIGS